MGENTDGLRTQIDALLEEQGTAWSRVQEIAFGEGGLAADDQEEFNALNDRLDEIEDEIATRQRALDRAAAIAAAADEREDLPFDHGDVVIPEDQRQEDAEAYSKTFWKWARGGMESLNPDERALMDARYTPLEARAQGTLPGTAGGFTIPEGFWNAIIEAQLAFGGLRNAGITQITTASGNDIPVPTDDDTGNVGELLAENTQVTEQDVVFGQKVLKAYTWSSRLVRVSFQLLQDSAFDMDAFLGRKLGMRIGRAQAQFWVDGTGVNQPEGILVGITTEAAQNAASLEYDDFVNLEHAVDVAYRTAGAEYVLSDDALKQTRLIKDLDDRPLWMPAAMSGFESGFPATINGFPYTVDVNMPDVATGETPIVFGDLSHYWIRDVLDIQLLRLTERYADFLQVGFIAFSRSDGRAVDAGDDPYIALEMA